MTISTTTDYRAPGIDQQLLETTTEFQGYLPMPLRSVQQLDNLSSTQIRNRISNCSLPASQNAANKLSIKPLPFSIHNKRGFDLRINNKELTQDGGLHITGCSDFTLTADNHFALQQNEKFFIEITHCHSFSIAGIITTGGRNSIVISGSSDFKISHCQAHNATGYGLIIHNSDQFMIEDCLYQNNLCSGIMILGRSTGGSLKNCICRGSRGYFNYDAGIHLCATSPNIILEQIPEQCHESLSIEDKTFKPHNILIEGCLLSSCRAQGLYLEGAVNCLIQNNLFVNNNKEGICFDWGSCYNIFTFNTVSLNGERQDLTEEEIIADFITDYPLLKDGSSSMKLPGISLDNGCLNLIHSNKIVSNFGGGIKMIRSSLVNTIDTNLIVANAIGANKYIPHFHAVSVLGVGAVHNEFKGNKNRLLEFLPSILNSITNNIIKEHKNPIFYDKVSSNNYISGNLFDQNSSYLSTSAKLIKRITARIKRLIWHWSKNATK